jgi:hypothetical protein
MKRSASRAAGMSVSVHWCRPYTASLCARCRGDRALRQRTDELTEKFRKDLPAVLAEARSLSDELAASATR